MTYSQSAGTISFGVTIIPGCYAGKGEYKNKPECQNLKDRGPLPRGVYYPQPLEHLDHLGPCIHLIPDAETKLFIESLGRDWMSFFIHLDNPKHPGASSDGCIVLPNGMDLAVVDRERGHGETTLEVVA